MCVFNWAVDDVGVGVGGWEVGCVCGGGWELGGGRGEAWWTECGVREEKAWAV